MPQEYYPMLSATDDGFWTASTFDNSSLTLRMGNVTGTPTNAFFRFNNISFNGTVNASELYVRSAFPLQNNAVALRLYAELAADPTAPVSFADANSRVLTTAFLDWIPQPWLADVYWDIGDISELLQELLSEGFRYDGTQAVNIFVKDNGSAANVNRFIETFEATGSPETIPYLGVNWTSRYGKIVKCVV